MRKINNVRPPIAQHPIAVEVKGTPVKRMVFITKGHHFSRSAPKIIIQGLRNPHLIWIDRNTFVFIHEPERRRLECLNLHNVLRDTGFDHLPKLHCAARGVALISHLRNDTIFFLSMD